MSDIEKIIKEQFLAIPLRPSTMTFYTVRRSIAECVRGRTASFRGTVLDVGCGFMPYRSLILSNGIVTEYIGMDLPQSDIYGAVQPDLVWDGSSIPLPDGSVDCVLATEFLEHHSDPEAVLAELWRVMRPGGELVATVPFIWNLHEIPHDEYRYTPFSLERHFRNARFESVEVATLGGWNRSLAQMLGLWVGFSKMGRVTRRIMRLLLFPVYVLLIRTDRPVGKFDGFENSMFTGLCVTARR